MHIFYAISGEVTDSKTKIAIFSFKPMKASGPDGLHPFYFFFKKFWDIVGQLVTTHIKNISSKKILEDLNSTLICLVQKAAKPKIIQQFRPIDLCNAIYKTITKILVLRIKPYLDDLIHPFQANFIPTKS
ncbi:hypothetical protein SO802_002683 [Lithocarpus litseifolius]|uniref:Reverse transcriptase domain-containing protein n=1 Tax=Lithocarpus litseifolius TaxID=425828 RepID=A0AAW2DZU6_9ROSI